MESTHKDILVHLRENIIADMDIDNDIIQPLLSEYILKEEDVRHIKAEATKEDRARILLDILPGRGRCAFDVFHQSLKHHYEWLADDIDKLLEDEVDYETEHEIETCGLDYLGPPSLPPVSPLTVTREEKTAQLKEALQQLKSAEYVTLHGMKGFGKSCLIASTIKDTKLMKNIFFNRIYWIKFAYERSIDEEILIQLNTLYHDVRNLEIQSESFTPPLGKDALIRCLKYHFNKPDHRNSLLILDDVFHRSIITNFDFQCKTLVLTTDIDVLDGRKTKIIGMNDGFTEKETLGLFAEVLETDIKELPIEAKKIHEECKGMPLLIAMFAAQFEEFKHDMKIRSDRWKYYLQSLRKKDAESGVIKEFLEKQETIFNICIEQLEPDAKKNYMELAIFSEDVNITPKTLEIIWGHNINRVEEMMLELCHKSLAAKRWNQDLKSYIYGVHDLLLCHVRKKLTQDELTDMHKSVIEKYRKYCGNDFSKLPNDNYIHSYIGYHLEQAKMFHEFPRIYLNFDFIQAKILYTGLSDLLLDLKKYRTHITKNKDDENETVSNIEAFLQEQASTIVNHKRKKCLDIMQIAMIYDCNDYIAQSAKNAANSREKYLYLFQDKKTQVVNIPLSDEISSGTCSSAFTDDPNSVLIGDTSGKVILWDCENKKQTIFNGHNNKCSIIKIIVSAKGDCFLTLTDTGIMKLFLLHCDETFDYNHVSSPRQKQVFWADVFANVNNQDDSLIEFSIENEVILDMAFTHDDKYIAASTNRNTIKMWTRDGQTIFTIANTKFESVGKIAFTDQSSLLHIMDESKGAFFVYSNSMPNSTMNNSITYQYVSCYNPQLNEKEIIFFHHVPEHENSLMIVTEKRAFYVKWRRSAHQVHNFKKQERAYVENDKVTYVCAAITYDGEYLVVADSAGFINVWNADTGYQPIATYKSYVTSLDTYWLEEERYHLICGIENRSLHRWKFQIPPIQQTSGNSKTQELNEVAGNSLFDAIVQPHNKMDMVVKEGRANKIEVLIGENKVADFESKEGKILNLQFFSDKKILYVTEKHVANLFDRESMETISIFKLSRSIDFLKVLNIEDNDVIICQETDNNLKVWQNVKIAYIVENTGRVSCIHKLSNEHVITITQHGVITIWYIDQYWRPINRISDFFSQTSNIHILFSCLSHKKTYLAVLNKPHDLALFTFLENTWITPTHIQMEVYYICSFPQKVTCCDISQDEQYIAIGFETGQIFIIDIKKKKEICQLCFHSNPIMQLSWAPTAIDVPILLSLTNDELAWWNIALANNEINSKKRRSRMGISHSMSTSSFIRTTSPILQIPNSQSIDSAISNLVSNEESSGNTANDIHASAYWKKKIGKDPEVPALLAAIELQQTRTAKVCISPDFTKFLTVDIYGSVNILKLFGYT